MDSIELFFNNRIADTRPISEMNVYEDLTAELGDFFLTPVRYLFHGDKVTVSQNDNVVTVNHRLEYGNSYLEPKKNFLNVVASIILLIPGILFGIAIKSFSYISELTRERHKLALSHYHNAEIRLGTAAVEEIEEEAVPVMLTWELSELEENSLKAIVNHHLARIGHNIGEEILKACQAMQRGNPRLFISQSRVEGHYLLMGMGLDAIDYLKSCIKNNFLRELIGYYRIEYYNECLYEIPVYPNGEDEFSALQRHLAPLQIFTGQELANNLENLLLKIEKLLEQEEGPCEADIKEELVELEHDEAEIKEQLVKLERDIAAVYNHQYLFVNKTQTELEELGYICLTEDQDKLAYYRGIVAVKQGNKWILHLCKGTGSLRFTKDDFDRLMPTVIATLAKNNIIPEGVSSFYSNRLSFENFQSWQAKNRV